MIVTRIRLLLLIFLFIFPQSGNSQYNCFSVLVGKNATTDGSVLFAHNEDDSGVNLVNWYKVPRLTHHNGENISLINGGQIQQVDETYSFLWLEMPGQTFSDSYMNEWGVTIASNACRSKEDSAELVNGGIGYFLRRIIVERAKSAKDAVKIAGAIVDSIGYASSGRTLCIADPNEAWMMSIVKGKHWVAQRVPDEHVAIIPNYYTIQNIDLTDTLNFLGSTDIIAYAIERGWHSPEKGKEFNFRLAYGKPSSINSNRNMAREWGAVNLLSPIEYKISDNFPFSFKPKEEVSKQDLMNILQHHYEGTSLEDKTISSPHDYDILPICRKDTQYGMIAQLRNWLPTEIGSVMWLAPHRPCSQVFIPWYGGITKFPQNFAGGDYNSALESHFVKYDDIKIQTSSHKFWDYVDYAEEVDNNYYELMPSVTSIKKDSQNQIFKKFSKFDKKIKKQFKRNSKKAIESINSFTSKMVDISIDYLTK